MSALETIRATVKSLRRKEARVLELLYGFEGKERAPHPQVAQLVGCHARAVEEIATGAIRKLRHPVLLKSIAGALDGAEDEIWGFVGGRDQVLYKNEITSAFEDRLPGEYQVAVMVRYNSFNEWLPRHACDMPRAWYRGRYSREELLRVIDRIEMAHREMGLPMPLQSLLRTLRVDLDLLVLAIGLAGYSSIFKGYFAKSHSGVRIGRAVHLHRMFSFTYKEAPVSLGRLVKDYNDLNPDDPVGPDEIEIALSTKPHLFLQLGDMGWVGIGLIEDDWSHLDRGAPPTPPESDGRILRHLAHREPPGSDFAEIVRQALSGGPLHISEITPQLMEEIANERVPKTLNSVLKGSEDLVALAPEVFGLHRHLGEPAIMEAAIGKLMNHRQCFLYTVARFAGEPADAYPLWGPSMEMKMCCWAENTDAFKLFPSLMAVADPGSWEAPDGFKKLWIFKKKMIGRYRIPQKVKKSAWSLRPGLGHLLAAAMCARQLGYINWLRINDIVKPQLYQQLYDHDAVPVLAILIVLGLVEPTDHWQKPHGALREPGSVLSSLSRELHQNGHIRWTDESGKELLSRIEQACHAGNLGWVPAGDLEALVRSLAHDEISADVHGEYNEPTEEKQPQKAGAAPAPVQLRLPFRRV